jgi:hypothetical protein
MSTIQLDNLISGFSSVYREKAVEFKEDPLVLACVVKHLLEKDRNSFHSLESDYVQSQVTDEHRAHAEAIRKYYTRKFFWKNLTDNNRISDYRSRLCYLLESHERKCLDRDAGIYYKLPWFYDEDMIYDAFIKNYETVEVPNVKIDRLNRNTLELTYLKSSVSTQQKRKLERFWFTDGKYLYNIEVMQDNPLIEMFKTMIEVGKVSKFQTFYKIERIDKMHFYKLFQFNFLKEDNA